MQWAEWEPLYAEILADFGYSRKEDELARDELRALVAMRRLATLDGARDLIEGADALVVGPAFDRLPLLGDDMVVLATDAAVARVVDEGLFPHVLVTDLDGNVPAQVEANRAGALAVVHAHGDNRPALAEWVPRFTGPLLATTQCESVENVHNFGGFTDGDRAVLLADHFGAASVTLVGFDFAAPVAKDGRDAGVKRRKLAWAERLIARARCPVALSA